MTSRYYVLDGKTVTPCPGGPNDLLIWAQAENGIVSLFRSEIRDEAATVSTVFVGVDQHAPSDAPPALFETIWFRHHQRGVHVVGRTATWEAAKDLHDRTVKQLADSTHAAE